MTAWRTAIAMDVVKLRLMGVPISALGEEAVEEALREIGYAKLSGEDILRLLVAGASAEALARATGMTPGQVKKAAREAYAKMKKGRSKEKKEEEGEGRAAQTLDNEWVRLLRSRRS
ncbi:MAG: hypothetical protein QXI07_09005 [Pyrobaculum sp.]